MSRSTFLKLFRTLLTLLILALVILALMITFSDGKAIPTWQMLYELVQGKPVIENADGDDYFKVIDVGEGDALLFSSNGTNMLLDTGPSDHSAELKNRLRAYGIRKIDLLSFSHFDSDHTGGTSEISEAFSIDNLLLPQKIILNENGKNVADAWMKLQDSGGKEYLAVPGMTAKVGDFLFTVLFCDATQSESNNRSMVLMAEIGDRRILLTGDAERTVEAEMVRQLKLSCDILKVAHHGSDSSSSAQFLAAVSPENAVISCGAGNRYGHPDESVLAALQDVGAAVYRTDTCGDVTFVFENNDYAVETER